MGKSTEKLLGRIRRKQRVKNKRRIESGRARLTVFRSNHHLYAQIIDDAEGKVLVALSSRSKDLAAQIAGKHNLAAAKIIGTALAERAKALKIERVTFDRNGYRYHGKIKALADCAREGGLVF